MKPYQRSQAKPLRLSAFLIVGVFAVLMACVGFRGGSSSSHQSGNGSLLIKNVRIFDGERVIGANSVLVEGGKIAKLGRDLAAPGAQTVDGHGGTLLPGLIDSHTHCSVRAGLQQILLFGVTTNLDMADDPKFSIPIQKAEATGGERGLSDIFTAGWPVTTPGGHGTEFGVPCPTISRADEAQGYVDARIAEGSNYIKILYDTGVELGFPFKNMTKEMVAAAVRAAHKRGKLTVIHILERKLADDAIDVGVDGFAHLFMDEPPSADFGKRVAAHHMFAIPTLTTIEACSGVASGESLTTSPLAAYLTPTPTANLKNSFAKMFKPPHPLKLEYALEAVRQLNAVHVPVLAGTDSPVPGTWYGASVHRELELLVRAGLKPQQALAAATSVPAKVFGLKDRGRIAVGLRADLLLVSGDPTKDVRETRGIVTIWKLGTPVDRDALKDTWEKAVAAIKKPGPKSGS